MTERSPALTYSSYLALDEVLGAQRPRSDEHDEMLFHYDVPAHLLKRNVGLPLEPSRDVQRVLLQAHRDDGEPAQVAERLVDIDEGVQEWRYRHIKMGERTIGNRPGTGSSTGAAYLPTTLLVPLFPDLWAGRSEL